MFLVRMLFCPYAVLQPGDVMQKSNFFDAAAVDARRWKLTPDLVGFGVLIVDVDVDVDFLWCAENS